MKRSQSKLIFSAIVSIVSAICSSQVNGGDGLSGGIFRCGQTAFLLSAPEGWVGDPELASQFGVIVAFHTEDLAKAPGVLCYCRCAPKVDGIRTIPEYLEFNRKSLEADGSKLVIAADKAIKTAGGNLAQIYRYSGAKSGRLEIAAYLDRGESIHMIVLTVPDADSLRRNLPAFQAFVSSYVAASAVDGTKR